MLILFYHFLSIFRILQETFLSQDIRNIYCSIRGIQEIQLEAKSQAPFFRNLLVRSWEECLKTRGPGQGVLSGGYWAFGHIRHVLSRA
jgi:hypothetical protein